jgi:hypothetical protein
MRGGAICRDGPKPEVVPSFNHLIVRLNSVAGTAMPIDFAVFILMKS